MSEYEVGIVGGGLLGLATAYALLQKRPKTKVVLLEKEAKLAQHQSGHNSGVIHSGIYYKPGSAKALNCRKGYARLLYFCEEEGIPYQLRGKLIVARREEERAQLQALEARGKANQLRGLRFLPTQAAVQAYEPHVRGVAGLWVPETGVVDYEKIALRLQDKLLAQGLQLCCAERLCESRSEAGKIVLISSAARSYCLRLVINCAGLYADKVMRCLGARPKVQILPFRGEYYKLSEGASLRVRGLVYPVPDPRFPFLGVHFTRRIDGTVEAGPNAVLALAREGYQKSDLHWGELWELLSSAAFYQMSRKYFCTGLKELYRSYSKKAFLQALQQYLPSLQSKDLLPGAAGVRAQACNAAGHLLDDFVIEEDNHAIHVCNAPSPAATACLSIGEHIATLACHRLS